MVCACGPAKSGCGVKGLRAKARATSVSRASKACVGMWSAAAASVFEFAGRAPSLTVSIVVALLDQPRRLGRGRVACGLRGTGLAHGRGGRRGVGRERQRLGLRGVVWARGRQLRLLLGLWRLRVRVAAQSSSTL